MGIFKDFKDRIKTDYLDWKNEWVGLWLLRREQSQIRKAKKRAMIRNKEDGRTYYILKDRRGGINALNSGEVYYWTRKGLFIKMSFLQRLHASIGIVTSNTKVLEQYNQIQLKKEDK